MLKSGPTAPSPASRSEATVGKPGSHRIFRCLALAAGLAAQTLAGPTLALELHLDPARDKAAEWLVKGTRLYVEGDPAAAASAYRKAVELTPGDASAHYHLAVALQAAGDAGPAEESFRRCLERDPRHANARASLATLLAATGRADLARRELDEAMLTEPGDSGIHYTLGLLCLAQGRPEVAALFFGQALELNPGHALARLGLGKARSLSGQAEEGRTLVDAAAEILEASAVGAFEAQVSDWSRAIRRAAGAPETESPAVQTDGPEETAPADLGNELYRFSGPVPAASDPAEQPEPVPPGWVQRDEDAVRPQQVPIVVAPASRIQTGLAAPKILAECPAGEPTGDRGPRDANRAAIAMLVRGERIAALQSLAHAVDAAPDDAVLLNNLAVAQALVGYADLSRPLLEIALLGDSAVSPTHRRNLEALEDVEDERASGFRLEGELAEMIP